MLDSFFCIKGVKSQLPDRLTRPEALLYNLRDLQTPKPFLCKYHQIYELSKSIPSREVYNCPLGALRTFVEGHPAALSTRLRPNFGTKFHFASLNIVAILRGRRNRALFNKINEFAPKKKCECSRDDAITGGPSNLLSRRVTTSVHTPLSHTNRCLFIILLSRVFRSPEVSPSHHKSRQSRRRLERRRRRRDDKVFVPRSGCPALE